MNGVPQTTCDTEPIHTPGSVLGHGVLLIVEPKSHRVVALSANASLVISVPDDPVSLLGQPLSEVVSVRFLSGFEEGLRGLGQMPGDRARYFLAGLSPWNITLVVLDTAGHIGIEVTAAAGEALGGAQHAHFRGKDVDEDTVPLEVFLQRACMALRKATGFDRVMIYRFLPGWHGEVVSEDKRADTQTFLRHRFPSSDIPAPARALYLLNGLRVIPDALDLPVPLLSLPASPQTETWDLSHSRLRAVSPVHLEYMRNMGVRSSLSLALTLNGALWGLVACHARNRISLEPHDLAWCEKTAVEISNEITAQSCAARDAHAKIFTDLLSNFRPVAQSKSELCNHILSSPGDFLSVFRADGIAWVQDNRVDHVGFTPRRGDVLALAKLVRARGTRRVALETLQDLAPALNSRPTCGFLSLLFDESAFFVFRNEALREVTWGGDPSKTLASRGFGGDINPRQSFQTYVETLGGHSIPWSHDEERAFELFSNTLDALPSSLS
jgi:chemotaxis family two-component system sensor kinase Cph1